MKLVMPCFLAGCAASVVDDTAPTCNDVYGWPDCELGEQELAGCGPEPGCGDVTTTALAPDGTCWTFPDLCVPYGWETGCDPGCDPT